MTELSFKAKLLQAILVEKGKLTKLMKEIFEGKEIISLDLVKLGYNYSIWTHKQPKVHLKEADWIHIAAYCPAQDAEQFIEEVFFSEVSSKGDCLLALWKKNPKKVLYWLNLIHEYDPSFKTLSFNKTAFTDKLLADFNCQGTELFTRIYLSDEEKKSEKLDKEVQRVLLTKVKLREQFGEITGRNSQKFSIEIQDLQNQRDSLINSQSLTAEHADEIFNSLWEDNIEFNNPPTELLERTPQKVFVGRRDEDTGWGFSYSIEVKQLLKLAPMLSKESLSKIEKLFDHLPFWMNLYRPIENALFKFKPEKVISAWKSVLVKDLEIGDKRNSWAVGDRNKRTQPSVLDLLFGLERIRELKDKDLLISMINHYDGKIREKVQKLLKESL